MLGQVAQCGRGLFSHAGGLAQVSGVAKRLFGVSSDKVVAVEVGGDGASI